MPLRNQFESEAEWLDHLRLYFAAKALPIIHSQNVAGGELRFSETARCAYAMADAMLVAREAKS